MPGKSINKTIRLQLLVVLAGVLMLLAKFAAYFYTHSNTILTDALESIINVVAGSFALYSLYLASKPKDYDHPYGHGKVEFISAGFEGILVAISGILIIGKATFAFFHPRPLEHLDTGLLIIAVSGLINLGMGMLLVRAGNQNNSMTLTADGKHLLADAYSSFALVLGLVVILVTKLNLVDNLVAIIFGIIITYTGIRLARKSVAGIMDEADENLIRSIVKHANENRKPQWIDVHNLRVIQFGDKLHIDCHVTLPWYYTLKEAHDQIELFSAVIDKEYDTQVEFFIHGDPCIRESCKLCALHECKVRQQPFTGLIEWTEENFRQNKKHGL